MPDHVVHQIVVGVYQVQLPLPFPLRIVNCYLLEDEVGWTLIDCGLNYAAGRETWATAFRALGIEAADIRRIILTHAHPDHYGMAGWLANAAGTPVLLAPVEHDLVRRMWQSGATAYTTMTAFFRAHGLPTELATQIDSDVAVLQAMTAPWPALTPLEPGTRLRIGARSYEAISTPGHSDGHLVFYCAEERLLLCGDAVLAKITPNVGLWPGGLANPLADFLHSLDLLGGLAVDLALPGHGPLISALAVRVGEIRAHHAERLDRMVNAADDGATAYTICTSVFPVEELSSHQIRFAMAETLAHLEYLVGAGRLVRFVGDESRYRRR